MLLVHIIKFMFERVCRRHPTKTGISALFFWAIMPTLMCSLAKVPPYELLMFMYIISFPLLMIYFDLKPKKFLSKVPTPMLYIACICICANDFLYTFMYRVVEPGVAKLINFCSWPTFSIFAMVFLGVAKIKLRNILGIAGSVFILMYMIHDKYINNQIVVTSYYLLPIISAIFWGAHNSATRYFNVKESDYFVPVFFIGLCISVILHLNYESFYMPTRTEFLLLFFIGCTSHFFAYLMWIESLKNGNPKILLSLSYFNPLICIIVLSIFGYTHLTQKLLLCILMMSMSCFLGNMGIPKGVFNTFLRLKKTQAVV